MQYSTRKDKHYEMLLNTIRLSAHDGLEEMKFRGTLITTL